MKKPTRKSTPALPKGKAEAPKAEPFDVFEAAFYGGLGVLMTRTEPKSSLLCIVQVPADHSDHGKVYLYRDGEITVHRSATKAIESIGLTAEDLKPRKKRMITMITDGLTCAVRAAKEPPKVVDPERERALNNFPQPQDKVPRPTDNEIPNFDEPGDERAAAEDVSFGPPETEPDSPQPAA